MKLLIFIVFITICVQKGSSIRCYECSSLNNTFCVEPSLFDGDTINKFVLVTECEENVHTARQVNFFCRKIIQTIYHQGLDSQVVVTRGCGWMRSYDLEDCYRVRTDSHTETVCQCFVDGCNGGPDFTRNFWIILTSLTILFSF